jgi:hypothetical protein
MESPWAEKNIIGHCKLLADSYYACTQKELVARDLEEREISFLMYHSSFVIVSHGTEKDPVFNYANLKAQELWKLGWEDFIKMPSRLSAEAVEVNERQRVLDEVEKNGFISNYSGVRISSIGKRFKIKDTVLWNVVDERGVFHGQAAMFSNWEYL